MRATLLLGLAVADGSACGQAMYGVIMTPDDDGFAPCAQSDTDADTDVIDPETCDCNDFDPDVHPGAKEKQGDDVDSDCDGDLDT